MFSADNLEYIYGFIMACCCFGILSIDDSWPAFSVQRINPKIEELAMKRWDNALKECPDDKYRVWMTDCYDNNILAYFNTNSKADNLR